MPQIPMGNNKPRIIAAIVTLLLFAGSAVLLMCMSLHYSSAESGMRQWPPVDSSEILFADEFVAMGNVEKVEQPDEASPTAQSAPSVDGYTNENAGNTVAKSEDLVSTERPSEMTVAKPTPEPKGPTKAEIEAAERAKREQETSRNISKRVNFGGNTAGGDSNGTPESDGGKSTATTGMANASVGGRTLEHWSKPTGRATGTITVRVRVDRQGKVIRADYVSGTGAVASLLAARQSCEQAAIKSQFSVSLDAPAAQTGTITYHFK